MGGGDEFEEYHGGVGGALMRCPPVHRRGRSSSSPSWELSTLGVADSHYAKAVRMRSLAFDDKANGGTALPHPVLGGGYRDDNRDRRRGDPFVRLEDYYGNRDSADDGGRGTERDRRRE